MPLQSWCGDVTVAAAALKRHLLPPALSCNRYSRLIVMAVVLTMSCSTSLQNCFARSPNALSTAVADFNRQVLQDNAIGKGEPPLTEGEVVASIRGWIREQVPVSDATYAVYKQIADSKSLPNGARFEYASSWGFQGYEFKGWIIYLSVGGDKLGGYRYRLRTRWIDCDPSKNKLRLSD